MPLTGFTFRRKIFLKVDLPEVARFLERFEHRLIEIRLGQPREPAFLPGVAVDEIPQPEGQLEIVSGAGRQGAQVDPIRRAGEQVDQRAAILEIIHQQPRGGG